MFSPPDEHCSKILFPFIFFLYIFFYIKTSGIFGFWFIQLSKYMLNRSRVFNLSRSHLSILALWMLVKWTHKSQKWTQRICQVHVPFCLQVLQGFNELERKPFIQYKAAVDDRYWKVDSNSFIDHWRLVFQSSCFNYILTFIFDANLNPATG